LKLFGDIGEASNHPETNGFAFLAKYWCLLLYHIFLGTTSLSLLPLTTIFVLRTYCVCVVTTKTNTFFPTRTSQV
jgi:hypothetical protein